MWTETGTCPVVVRGASDREGGGGRESIFTSEISRSGVSSRKNAGTRLFHKHAIGTHRLRAAPATFRSSATARAWRSEF